MVWGRAMMMVRICMSRRGTRRRLRLRRLRRRRMWRRRMRRKRKRPLPTARLLGVCRMGDRRPLSLLLRDERTNLRPLRFYSRLNRYASRVSPSHPSSNRLSRFSTPPASPYRASFAFSLEPHGHSLPTRIPLPPSFPPPTFICSNSTFSLRLF